MTYRNISLAILGTLLLIACATIPEKSAPGFYVNGWPTFTLSYPADWIEKRPRPGEAFVVEAPEGIPSLRIVVIPNINTPIEYSVRVLIPELAKIGKDINVIYDKDSQLEDGTPAREVQLEWIANPGIKLNSLFLTTQKEDVWIMVSLSDTRGRIDEDLKRIPYSLKIKPGKEAPVALPDDMQALFDQLSRDVISHDVEKVMLHYSDQFLHNGQRKANVEVFYKRNISGVTSFQTNITKFESQKDSAYVGGYLLINQTMKFPILGMPFIKENGQWKYYGNQKQM